MLNDIAIVKIIISIDRNLQEQQLYRSPQSSQPIISQSSSIIMQDLHPRSVLEL